VAGDLEKIILLYCLFERDSTSGQIASYEKTHIVNRL
jgi:hypothetical protein